MKKGRPKGTLGKARALNKSEIENSIYLISNPDLGGIHCLRNSAILATSYYLGLRAKELAALNISDVMFHDNKIKSAITLSITKGNKQRQVYIPDALNKILSRYLKTRTYQHNFLIQPLFLSQKQGAFNPNTMQRLLSHSYKQCGYTGCSSHTGRRSFATRLIESGADIKAVSTLMGHTTINMTAQYVEDNPQRLTRMVNKML